MRCDRGCAFPRPVPEGGVRNGTPPSYRDQLLSAALDGVRLKVTYESIESGVTERVIFSYGLYASQGYWYCACFDRRRGMNVPMRRLNLTSQNIRSCAYCPRRIFECAPFHHGPACRASTTLAISSLLAEPVDERMLAIVALLCVKDLLTFRHRLA